MSILSTAAAQWAAGLIGAVLALVGGVFALPVLWAFAKRAWPWLLAALAFVLLVVVPMLLPAPRSLDRRLPDLLSDHYRGSLLVFGLGAFVSVVALGRLVRPGRPAAAAARPDAPEGEAAGRFDDLDAAWEEIAYRLDQAEVDLAGHHVYLLIAPDEEASAALVRSAGLRLFAEAPEGPSPIHAYATPDGVLLSCAGASSLGTPGGGGAARMEALCRKLLALQPECPVVRGVAVLFPIEWDGQADAPKRASAVRDDLQAIARVLKVRVPVFAIVSQMEAVPGFSEFAGRMTAPMLGQRAGFAVPSSHEFSGDLVNRGMVWLSGWFQAWILSLISGDILNDRGNARLARLDHEIRRRRKRLRSILESAFSSPREAEPVLFRGCYVVGTGDGPDESAFSAGLLRGPRSRILADHAATRWSTEAEAEDRRHLRLAIVVGVVGGLLILSTWAWMATRDPLWALGLVAVALTWIVAIFRMTGR